MKSSKFFLSIMLFFLIVLYGCSSGEEDTGLSDEEFEDLVKLPPRCNFPPGVACMDHTLLEDGTLELVLANARGATIKGLDIQSDECVLHPDYETLDSMENGETSSLFLQCQVGRKGSYFKSDLKVSYVIESTNELIEFEASIGADVGIDEVSKEDKFEGEASDEYYAIKIIDEASSTKDPELCQQIEDSDYADECFNEVAKAIGDPEICGNIVGASVLTENICMLQVAYEIKDVDVCNRIKSPSERVECVLIYATSTNDLDLCNTIKTQSGVNSKDHCILSIANNLGDETLCEDVARIDGDRSRDTCYILVAIQKFDESLCEKVTVQSGKISKDTCYNNLAINTGYQSYCDNIVGNKDGVSKENCSAIFDI